MERRNEPKVSLKQVISGLLICVVVIVVAVFVLYAAFLAGFWGLMTLFAAVVFGCAVAGLYVWLNYETEAEAKQRRFEEERAARTARLRNF